MAESATETERAAARRVEKKGQADTASQTAVPLPAAPLALTPLPVPLRLLLPPDSAGNAPTAGSIAPAAQGIPTPVQTAAQQDTAGNPVAQSAPPQVVPPQVAPPQTQSPQDLSFAVQVGPQDPSAAVPPPPPVEVPVQLKLDDLAGQKDAGKNNPKPAGSAIAIDAHAPERDFAASVTPIKETQRAEFGLDPSSPGAGILARGGTFQPTNPGTPEPAGSSAPNATRAQESAAIESLPADNSAKPAAPLKDLSIQVGQNQQDKVELRVVERAGGLEVAVRAANPDLNQGLRQGLSELVNRLEQNGYRTEAWRPGTTVSTVQGTADTRQKSAQFQNDGSQSQSGSQQGRQQNQQNQTPRPRWVQELEGRLSGESNATAGGSYGVTN